MEEEKLHDADDKGANTPLSIVTTMIDDHKAEEEKQQDKTDRRHFLILAHGNNGAGIDWNFVVSRLSARTNEFVVMVSHDNERRTSEGIAVGAERLSQEIIRFLEDELKDDEVVYFSVMGHSLGGLYLRACLPTVFHRLGNQLIPISYTSLSSPHLGSRRPGGGFTKGVWRACVHTALNSGLYSQTGKELLLEESDNCLLSRMADPDEEYMQCLGRFKYRTLYSIAHGDLAVPFASAAIRSCNPYPIPPKDHNYFEVLSVTGFDDSLTNLLSTITVVSQQALGDPSKDPFPGIQCTKIGDVTAMGKRKKDLEPPPGMVTPPASPRPTAWARLVSTIARQPQQAQLTAPPSLSSSGEGEVEVEVKKSSDEEEEKKSDEEEEEQEKIEIQPITEESEKEKKAKNKKEKEKKKNRGKGKDENEKEKEEGNEEDYYYCDNTRHVEYLPRMLKNLQSLTWRRFDVQFGGKTAPHVHDMWLKKRGKVVVPQWILAYDAAQSDTFVDILVQILAADHNICSVSSAL